VHQLQTQSIDMPAVVAPTRDAALDFVKGALVLLMVFYHWVSYIAGQQFIDYRYIRFVTPSFVLITGFVVSHVYLKRYAYDSPVLAKRLIQRGLKLVCLFAVLNLLALAPDIGDAPSAYWSNLIESVVVRGQGRASFIILLSIGYLLLLSPLVLLAAARLHVPLVVTAIVVVASCWLASAVGRVNLHGEFLSMGLIGLAAGANAGSEGYGGRLTFGWIALLYALYLAAVVMWNVIYPVQVIAACVNVLVLYRLGCAVAGANALRWIVTLGKYSLLAYIGQILILRVIRMALQQDQLPPATLFLTFVIAVGATVASVQMVAFLRRRVTAADWLYRAVFA
jgi:peptidoglycan/LPS O-acetylase OafA/YrhL